MRRASILLSGIACIGLAACAEISTFTDPRLSADSKTGILYYPPKPYLLVSRTGAKDKPNDVQVIYLPDLANPRYAVMTGGFGSSKLGLTFTNGVLMSANQESDPKLVEAITALAGVPGQLASAAKTRAETADIRAEASDYPAVAASLRDIAGDIRTISGRADAATLLKASQLAGLKSLPAQIDAVATRLDAPGMNEGNVKPVVDTLEAMQKLLAAIKPGADDPGEAGKPIWALIRSVETSLGETITALKPKPEAPPTLTLYEVTMNGGGTQLVEVPLTTIGAKP